MAAANDRVKQIISRMPPALKTAFNHTTYNDALTLKETPKFNDIEILATSPINRSSSQKQLLFEVVPEENKVIGNS